MLVTVLLSLGLLSTSPSAKPLAVGPSAMLVQPVGEVNVEGNMRDWPGISGVRYELEKDTSRNKNGQLIGETPPEYPGGDNALFRMISRNLRYPYWARLTQEEGTVFVHFMVNEDGHLSDIRVINNEIMNSRGLKASSLYLHKEALRVINLMPNWIPGYLEGKPVKVRVQLPIKFKTS